MTTPPDTDEDKSLGQLAYEAFHAEWPHDWDNASDQRRWCRAGEAVAKAVRMAKTVTDTMKLNQPKEWFIHGAATPCNRDRLMEEVNEAKLKGITRAEVDEAVSEAWAMAVKEPTSKG